MTSTDVSHNETNKVVENTLRSFEVFTHCPHCRKGVETTTVKTCNFANLLCCIFLTGCWECCQMFKVKDMNCYDATHSCKSCGKQIGTYSAC